MEYHLKPSRIQEVSNLVAGTILFFATCWFFWWKKMTRQRN